MTDIQTNDNKPLIVIHSGHFRSKYTSTISFGIGCLLFLLPFLNIKCNDTKLMSATGFQLVTGTSSNELSPLSKGLFDKNKPGIFDDKYSGNDSYGPSSSSNSYSSNKDGLAGSDKLKKDGDLPPNYFLLGSLILAVAAIAMSFFRFKNKWMFCYIAGWGSVLGFIMTVMWTYMKLEKYTTNLGGLIDLSVNFTFWFFLSCLAMIAGSLFSHNQYNREWSARKKEEIEAYIRENGTAAETMAISENAGAQV